MADALHGERMIGGTTYRPRERRSALAAWSRRLALLSLPVLVIAAAGQRSGHFDAFSTYAAMALGFVIAALAVIAAGAAFEGIWRDGRKGAGAAVAGLLIGLAVLALPAMAAWDLLTYPQLTDISTDTDDPPAFDKLLAERGPDARPLVPLTDDQVELQHQAYPDIVPRHYDLPPVRVFDAALALVNAYGWMVATELRPEGTEDNGAIEAVAETAVFGFKQDVVIRVEPDGDGALVDMRSAARNGAHDLGADANRIRDFFADLDTALEGVSE